MLTTDKGCLFPELIAEDLNVLCTSLAKSAQALEWRSTAGGDAGCLAWHALLGSADRWTVSGPAAQPEVADGPVEPAVEACEGLGSAVCACCAPPTDVQPVERTV